MKKILRVETSYRYEVKYLQFGKKQFMDFVARYPLNDKEHGKNVMALINAELKKKRAQMLLEIHDSTGACVYSRDFLKDVFSVRTK